MFGGFDQLSNAAEAKARKERQQKKSNQKATAAGGAADDDNDSAVGGNTNHEDSRLLKLQALRQEAADTVEAEFKLADMKASSVVLPELTTAEAEDALVNLTMGHDRVGGKKEFPIPKDSFLEFIDIACKRLRSPEARSVIRYLFLSPNKDMNSLSTALVNMQRACFAELDIEVDHGCNNLARLEIDHPEDFDLLERRNCFLNLCRIAFLRGVDDGLAYQKKQAADKGETFQLQSSGDLPKEKMLLFIEMCSVVLQTDESRTRLRKAFEDGVTKSGNSTGGEKEASNMCLIIQYETMERCGIDKVFGVTKLNMASSDYPNDRELMQKMNMFAQACAQMVGNASISQGERFQMEQKSFDVLIREAKEEKEDAARENLQVEGTLTRDQLMSFFKINSELLDSTEVKTKLKKLARTPDGTADLNRVMIEIQKGVFPTIGVSRKLGNEGLSLINTTYGDDKELMEVCKQFALKCSASWIEAVRASKPKKLQTNGRMTKKQIINFIDGCQALLSLPETRNTLREAFLSTKSTKLPSEISVKMQRDMLESLGVEANFGVGCLNKLGTDFAQDREVIGKMQQFSQVAQQAVALSTMSDEEFAVAKVQQREKEIEARKRQAAMQERAHQVQLAVNTMNQEEKEAVKLKMKAKWSTLMRLPQQDKMNYLSRLPDHDQIDFAMMSAIMMQEKMLEQVGSSVNGKSGADDGSSNAAAEPLPPQSTDKSN